MIRGVPPVPKLLRLLVTNALTRLHHLTPIGPSLAKGACLQNNGLLMGGQVDFLGFYYFTVRGMNK